MNVQYISDNLGNKTAVVIAIEDWEIMKKCYPDIENLEDELPQWQKDIVLSRLNDPQATMDAFEMIDDLEK
ncbi:addiction module component CHP02574 family protein [Flavobacterium sp. 7A]|uniref:addiction module component CHP02574 family protein n=1 Tax=Flavobacterium sp. 7A TaxID=2940571 RepID=UPI002226C52F|nr:addiction module component CHP02574 family protein [Flavobacterium sp. 7A]MCW2120607.1 hypothetical protein [Flavobacterium sp. 7A]